MSWLKALFGAKEPEARKVCVSVDILHGAIFSGNQASDNKIQDIKSFFETIFNKLEEIKTNYQENIPASLETQSGIFRKLMKSDISLSGNDMTIDLESLKYLASHSMSIQTYLGSNYQSSSGTLQIDIDADKDQIVFSRKPDSSVVKVIWPLPPTRLEQLSNFIAWSKSTINPARDYPAHPSL